MARFTTRVELHRHKPGDYDRLHTEMEAEGFTRTIDATSNTLHLPTAEYNYVGTIEDQHVILEMARRAAAAVRPSFEILVTKSAGRAWYNLQPA